MSTVVFDSLDPSFASALPGRRLEPRPLKMQPFVCTFASITASGKTRAGDPSAARESIDPLNAFNLGRFRDFSVKWAAEVSICGPRRRFGSR